MNLYQQVVQIGHKLDEDDKRTLLRFLCNYTRLSEALHEEEKRNYELHNELQLARSANRESR